MIQSNLSAHKFIFFPFCTFFCSGTVSSSQQFCGLFLQSIWQHIKVADLELLKGFMVVKYRVWIWRAHLHTLTSLAFAIQAKLSGWQFQSTAFYSCFEKTIFKQNSKQIRNNNTQKQKDNLEEYWAITVPI